MIEDSTCLLPCPFCGGEGKLYEEDLMEEGERGGIFVSCSNCKCAGYGFTTVKAWNTRLNPNREAFDRFVKNQPWNRLEHSAALRTFEFLSARALPPQNAGDNIEILLDNYEVECIRYGEVGFCYSTDKLQAARKAVIKQLSVALIALQDRIIREIESVLGDYDMPQVETIIRDEFAKEPTK